MESEGDEGGISILMGHLPDTSFHFLHYDLVLDDFATRMDCFIIVLIESLFNPVLLIYFSTLHNDSARIL